VSAPHPIALFCKSYRGDLDRCAQLVESIRRHNREGLPCYLSVPASDRAAFLNELGQDGIELLTDEEVIGGSIAQTWTSQQLVKLRFARRALARTIVWFDSDFVIIRDFDRREFFARDGVPYTLFSDMRRNLFQDRLLGDPAHDAEYARMLAGLERPFALIRDSFERRGPLYFFGPPVIWSVEVVAALERWAIGRGLSFEMLLSLSPFELNWYGEFLFANQTIPVVPRPDPAFHFTRDWELRRFKEQGLRISDLVDRGFLAVNFASKWMASAIIPPQPVTPPARGPAPGASGAARAPGAGGTARAPGALDLGEPWRGTYHRTGWGWALDALAPLHRTGGVRVEGFVDKKFGWGRDPGDRGNGFTPYLEPWVGFWHNPPAMPEWFNGDRQAPHDILQSDEWRASAPACQGLFTLSEALARWLRARVDVPVSVLRHPSPEPRRPFSLEAYRSNPDPCIAQVGWWLRRFVSLRLLPVTRLRKVFLDLRATLLAIGTIMQRELDLVSPERSLGEVSPLPYLDNDAYDEFLSRNLVFLHLYDASATNTLVECIQRATPLLVNPLDAVVEYLGADYPLYFTTLAEAAAKAEDDAAIGRAHAYLRDLPIKRELTQSAFRAAFERSEICRRLGIAAPAGQPGAFS
jgi:hypothetical protein